MPEQLGLALDRRRAPKVERPGFHKAVVALRKAGLRVARTAEADVHLVDGEGVSSAKLMRMAQSLLDHAD